MQVEGRDGRRCSGGSGRRCRGGSGQRRGHVLDDLAEGLQLGHRAGVDLRKLRGLVAHRAEDLHPLDAVDAEVAFQRHLRREHLGRVAGLVSDHAEQERVEVEGGRRRHRGHRGHRGHRLGRAHERVEVNSRSGDGGGRSRDRSGCQRHRDRRGCGDGCWCGDRRGLRDASWRLGGGGPGHHRGELAEAALHRLEEDGVGAGHRVLEGRVGLDGLTLALLEGLDPTVRCRTGCGAPGSLHRSLHRNLHRDLDADLLDDFLHDDLGLEFRVGTRHLALWRRIGLAVVGPVDVHEHLGSREAAGVDGLGPALPELRELHFDASGDEAAEAVLQLNQAVLALLVQGHGRVRTPLQDARDETRQHRVWADLDEDAHAGGVHGLDLVDEAHAPGDLASEQLADRRWLAGVRSRLAVGVDRQRRRGEVDLCEGLGEGADAVGDDAGVESGGDTEAPEGKPRSVEGLLDSIDGLGRAAEHDLPRAVVVRDHDVEAAVFDHWPNTLDVRDDGGHRARGLRRLGHELASTAGDPEHVLCAEHARCVERGDLSIAVSTDAVGADTQAREHPQERERAGADGGLGPLGGGQPGLPVLSGGGEVRAGEDDVRESGDGALCGVPGTHCLGPGHRDLGSHVDVLAALTGEDEGGLASLAEAVVDALGRGQRLAGLVLQVAQRELELGAEVLDVGCHDGEAGLATGVALLRVTSEPLEPAIA